MKRVADEQEPVAGIPLIVEPVVVEDALVSIVVQHRNSTLVIVQRERASPSVSEAIRITTPLSRRWG